MKATLQSACGSVRDESTGEKAGRADGKVSVKDENAQTGFADVTVESRMLGS